MAATMTMDEAIRRAEIRQIRVMARSLKKNGDSAFANAMARAKCDDDFEKIEVADDMMSGKTMLLVGI